MKLRALLFVSCLMLSGYTYTMDYTLPVDPQMASILHTVPSEIVPKFLWMDTSWDTVRSVLALQQTCRLWHSMLNLAQKKKMISAWCRDGKDFNEHQELCNSLALLPMLLRTRESMTRSDFYSSDDVVAHTKTIQAAAPELYLLAGADVNYVDEYGRMALSAAIEAVNADDYSIPYIKLLIRMGASINHPDNEGNTPLHHASKNYAVHCVEVLLQHGADKKLTNLKGESPILCLRFVRRLTAQFERIRALLDGAITPEESIAKPIIEAVGSNTREPINEYAYMDFFG